MNTNRYTFATMSDSQAITFQSKFAARKAQEDRVFQELIKGQRPEGGSHVQSDVEYPSYRLEEPSKSSITHDAGAWDK